LKKNDDNPQQSNEQLIIIPKEKLSQEAFFGLIEEFILREGTDYGHQERTLFEKMQHIQQQIEAGHTQIVYSTLTGNTSLMTRSELSKYNSCQHPV